jgi:hypothetical protein
MSNELETDIAMVMNLESFGVHGHGAASGYDHDETETSGAAKFDSEGHVSGHSDCTFPA